MAKGLAIAFISNDDGNNVLVSSSLNGSSWSVNLDMNQASNGSAPSLAVFNRRLWAAFIANDGGQNVLICTSTDSVIWTSDPSNPSPTSTNIDIGQASNGSSPSLAVFDGKLWVAFIANDSGNNVLVCSSSDGVNWGTIQGIGKNTDIGQASNGSSPSLAVFDGKLWVAFIANDSGQNVLVCESSDGVIWGTSKGAGKNTDIGQASNGQAPALANFANFVLKACPAPTKPSSDPAPSPFGRLSDNNYVLNNVVKTVCNPILDLSVTICISEDIVSSVGFGFQLNAYSPKGQPSAWQQYGILLKNTEIAGFVDNWPVDGPNIINDFFRLCSVPQGNILQAGYRLTISLSNDPNGNVTGATYIVVDRQGVNQAEQQISLLSLAPAMNLAQIIAFEVNLVGPDNGESTVLSSGAGSISYSASVPMTVAGAPPSCAESAYITAEKANSVYTQLPVGPSKQITQGFSTGGGHTTAPRRPGVVVLKRTSVKGEAGAP
jgi:hypothetical protein